MGGLVSTTFCAWFPADNLPLLNAALFGMCLVQFVRIERRLERNASDNSDDEESGIIDAARSIIVVLRAFPLTGAIGAGIFLMSALFCLQDYLSMTIYAENITDADSPASFMAMAYAGQQAAEFLILALMGKLVLERAGPLVRNLFFPATTFAVLAALQSSWTLPLAVLVHINANAVSNAIFEPVKNLNYAALPFRMLAPVRMLVEGAVYPAGIALSGGALLWMQSAFAPPVVLAVALVLSVLFAAASGLVGLSFLPSLLRGLRLRAVSPSEYSNCEPGRRFSQSDIRYLLHHPDPEARSFGRDLARRLAPRLLRAEGLARPPIWEAAATAMGRLARGLSPEWCAPSGLLVAYASTAVRFDAGGVDRGRRDTGSHTTVSDILCGYGQRRTSSSKRADSDGSVELAARAVPRTVTRSNGDTTLGVGVEGLSSELPEVEASTRSLAIGTPGFQGVLRDRLRPPRRRVHLDRTAMRRRTRVGLTPARSDLAEWPPADGERSEWPETTDGNGAGRIDVGRTACGRRFAARTAAVSNVLDEDGPRPDAASEIADLGRGLEHATGAVRRTAARLLARKGDAAVNAAAQRLSSDRPEVVEAAIKTLGAIRTRKAQRVLHEYLRPLYRQARLNLVALEHVASVGLCEAARDALTDGLVDSNRRIVRRVLAVKSALGNRRDINLLLSLVQTNEPRVRSNAIEALTSLPTGRLIRPVLALLEVRESSAAEGPKPTRSDRASVADPAVAVWRAAADDRWLRLLAARLFAHRDEGIGSDGDDAMLDLILFLKSVPLFREMSFEDVARIADKTRGSPWRKEKSCSRAVKASRTSISSAAAASSCTGTA